MRRKYDNKLLQAISAGQYEKTVDDVKIVVKPIPEGGEDGDMDPRLYKSMKMAVLMMKFMPKRKRAKSTLEMVLPLRKMFNNVKALSIADDGVKVSHHFVESMDGYQVPLRAYRREKGGKSLPILVYNHGGGFFGGSPDVVDQMCKLLVQNLDCVVFNVDYRLCPENHYPQPFDDCWSCTRWVYDHAEEFGGDHSRIGVSGDSAGGNLAAAVTLRDRAEGTGMIKLQALLYPAINISGKHTEFYKGVDESKYRYSKRHGKVLRAIVGMMGSMMGGDPSTNMLDNIYLQGNLDPEHIYASPMLADLKGLPPTILLFGEHDFLAFEDFAYARALTAAGNKLRTVIYRGLGHGFADQSGIFPQAEDCMIEIAAYMKEMLK